LFASDIRTALTWTLPRVLAGRWLRRRNNRHRNCRRRRYWGWLRISFLQSI